MGGYLLCAYGLTWRLWADPADRMVGGNSGDIGLFAWFMRYSATAVSHGHLPALVTTAVNAPQGINLMWNTSVLLPGIVLAPVTLLAGPSASLNVLLTLGYAGSAASLYFVLRRWGANTGAAALGGAVYGFSPALVAAGMGHFQLQFAVLPPLIIDALLRILTGRGRAVLIGIGLGLMIAAQVFIGEELLASTAVAAVVILVVLAVGAVGRPRAAVKAIKRRTGPAAAGLGVAVAVAALICFRPLWVQFKGPLASHGSPWQVGQFYNHLYAFVTPAGNLLFHSTASANAANSYPEPPPEYLAYLGWPLLIVLIAAGIGFCRDPKVRLAALTCALLELFSLGTVPVAFFGNRIPVWLLPWHWLQHVPVLQDVLADRFSILADGAAGAVLAFALTRAWRLAPGTVRGRLTGALAALVAVLAVLPLIPRPLTPWGVPRTPDGWQATFTRLDLPADARVLIIPDVLRPMHWQAATGVPVSMIGGGDTTEPGPAGQATSYIYNRRVTAAYLYALWLGSPVGPAPSQVQIRADLAYWGPAAIVVPTAPGSPVARFLTREFGPPTVVLDEMLAWRQPHLKSTVNTAKKGK
jgi:hypothetical protein